MKTILLLMATSLTFFQQPDFTAVIAAIRTGNIAEISKYLDDKVEVAIGENDDTYSRADASKLIQNFFNTNAPKGCTIVHSGAARDQGSYYCIGKLNAGTKAYRLYIYFKKVGEQYRIQEIKFEEN